MVTATAAVFAAALGVSCYTNPNCETKKNDAQQVAKAVVPVACPDQHCKKADDSECSPCWKRFFTWPDGITALAILFTLLAIVLQSSETQKAANATLESVRDGKNTAKRQLRAYLAVTAGAADCQNRGINRKFTGTVNFINTGQTPARKVKGKIDAALLAVPLPEGTVLPEPREEISEATVGAQGTNSTSKSVDEFCDDRGVASIMNGVGKALCVWGFITYEDTFGEAHCTKFGFQFLWKTDLIPQAWCIPNHNDSD